MPVPSAKRNSRMLVELGVVDVSRFAD